MNAQRYEKKMIPPNFFVKNRKNPSFFVIFRQECLKKIKLPDFFEQFEHFVTSLRKYSYFIEKIQ